MSFWGGFAGGMSQGLRQGMAMGKDLRTRMKEDELEQVRQQGLKEAQEARNAAISDIVKQNGISGTTQAAPAGPSQDGGNAPAPAPAAAPAPAPVEITPSPAPAPAPASSSAPSANIAPASPSSAFGLMGTPTTDSSHALPSFSVGGKTFANRADAEAEAGKQVPNVADYFMKTGVPKLQEAYIAQGDFDKAESLGKWVESRRGQDAVKTFGKAMTKLMFTNDVDGGVKALGDYYNKFIDDGVDFVSHGVGEDGKINVTLKNKGNGTESNISLSKGDILRMGMAYDPAKLHEMALSQEAQNVKNAADIAKEDRKFKRDVSMQVLKGNQQSKLEDQKSGNRISEDTAKAQTDVSTTGAKERAKVEAQVGAKVDALRAAGVSDDFIKEALPGILGAGQYKRATSPDEARRLAFSDFMKSDPTFSRKPKEEQNKLVDQTMSIIYAGGKPGETGLPAAGKDGAAAPAKDAAPPAASPKGVYVRDKKTGEIKLIDPSQLGPVTSPAPKQSVYALPPRDN
ncbi:virion structural protein [Ralstonia phage Gamede]|uniref:Uncharacterized protein n=1 Tax=Ralstonia phage Gamede TaxID=2759726 RepID=A0A7G5BA37_9CAUD|nr:virion structural protein [Ralstonia phage Gamede]QMV33160.1 hypothetical protein 9Ga_00042 [Ralstonia phage Gamede]